MVLRIYTDGPFYRYFPEAHGLHNHPHFNVAKDNFRLWTREENLTKWELHRQAFKAELVSFSHALWHECDTLGYGDGGFHREAVDTWVHALIVGVD